VIAKGLYYGAQRLRSGVSPGMVDRASEILESRWPEVLTYVDRRITLCHDTQGSRGLSWLEQQPVTRRSEYEKRSTPAGHFLTRRQRRRTSGSSGRPFVFERSAEMLAWMDAAMWAVYGWHGIEPGDKMARFWGRPLSTRARIQRTFKNILLRQRLMNAFDVSPARSREFHAELLDWSPDYVYGYPTLIRQFVAHLRHEDMDGLDLGVRAVITTGEMLDDSTRGALREFFGCRVVDEYGCSEAGILACECEEGTRHLVPIAAYTEVLVDSETERDRPDRGRVVLTDLYGDSDLFRKYALNDMATLSRSADCPCGRDLPVLEVVSGRLDSFIRTPDGNKVYDAVLAYSVPREIVQFQVVQTAVDCLEASVVVASDAETSKVIEKCRRCWVEAIGCRMKIRMQVVDGISRSPGGKLRYFVPLEEASGGLAYVEKDRDE